MTNYRFKMADQPEEMEQIHRLNYAAFVEEIPQHAPNPARRLVDPFHAENRYAVALVDERVVGMIALRAQRPFSLDKKLAQLDSYLPPHRSMCEFRLLYIQPAHRNGKVLRGLMELAGDDAMLHRHDLAIVSDTTRQQHFYEHLGFIPFGPQVGSGEARFQPMYMTLESALHQTPWVRALQAYTEGDYPTPLDEGATHLPDNLPDTTPAHPALPHYAPPLNFLPGPVNIADDVLQIMSRPMISHRAPEFVADVARLQAQLCAQVQARFVEFLFGSGTLGNEAINAHLTQVGGRGLVLVNGEFGGRLVNEVRRWRLAFEVIDAPWGVPFDLDELAARLAAMEDVRWLWLTHSETSTGVMNDLAGIGALCRRFGVKLCVDCISSLGVVALDLREVYMASATSGKALGAVTGLAMVFYNAPLTPMPEALPGYLDLGSYRAAQGVPFTLNPNLVYALARALALRDAPDATHGPAVTADVARGLRADLRRLGFQILAPEDVASPAVTTIVLPPKVSSVAVGDALARQGFQLSYQSRYLVARNWIQICLMGDYRADALPDLLICLAHFASPNVPNPRSYHSLSHNG
jgi:aspartate aminotransferase-like enzyme